MKIAILGATSQIARDLIENMLGVGQHQLYLYAREPRRVLNWLNQRNLPRPANVSSYEGFGQNEVYDAIINFVGVGDPIKALDMGSSILKITAQYDDLALQFLKDHPCCKYIFLSSGAAYGGNFQEPVHEGTLASFPINQLGQTDWYGISKMYAEAKHRSMGELSIADIRVFNYLSHSQDIAARFLITDLIRALQENIEFNTNHLNLMRDYLGDQDFYQLVECLLSAEQVNGAFDCYTKEPVSKFDILESLQQTHQLKFKINSATTAIVNATGVKLNYYSINRTAQQLGYSPSLTSLDNIHQVVAKKISPATS